LTACLGASRVDAQLVVETIGVPNLCEHVPSSLMWACVAEFAARALGKPGDAAASTSIPTTVAAASPASPSSPSSRSTSGIVSGTVIVAASSKPSSGPVIAPTSAKPASGPVRAPLTPPPPDAQPVAPRPSAPALVQGPAIPAPSSDAAAGGDETDGQAGRRAPAGQRFRQSNTGIAGRPLGGTTRRPQAPAPAPSAPPTRIPKRVTTEAETETAVDSEWRGTEISVDDSQLVDWQAENTAPGDDDFNDLRNKRER
jgi:hypothetical protein